MSLKDTLFEPMPQEQKDQIKIRQKAEAILDRAEQTHSSIDEVTAEMLMFAMAVMMMGGGPKSEAEMKNLLTPLIEILASYREILMRQLTQQQKTKET